MNPNLRHVTVKFINCGSFESGNRIGTVIESILNHNPKGKKLTSSTKNYSYFTDIELSEGDFVIVASANGISPAVVTGITEDIPTDKKLNYVLAKITISDRVFNNSNAISDILNRIITNLSNDELTKIIVKAAKDIENEDIKSLVSELVRYESINGIKDIVSGL